MALVDYDELVSTVRELIAGTGRLVTFRELTSVAADPDKPWKPSGVPTDTESYATFVPLSSLQDLGLTAQDSDLLKRSKQACIVAPHETVDLGACHLIIDNDENWKIDWATVLRPGDTTLLIAFGVSK